MNPHIQYGRSDKRGFMLLEVTRQRTTTLFQRLDDAHAAGSGVERRPGLGSSGGLFLVA